VNRNRQSGAIAAAALPIAAGANAETLVVTSLVAAVAAGAAIFFAQCRRASGFEASDAALVADVRREVSQGRIPEARDRVKKDRGPLARVLTGILRFPYGIHREAIERALGDGLLAERPRFRGASRVLVVLALFAAALTAAAWLTAPEPTRDLDTLTILGVAGACVIGGFWWSLRSRARGFERRVDEAATSFARLVVAFAESPAIVDPAGGAEPRRARTADAQRVGAAAGAGTV
jgi:hypothetical protein